jgi:aspartyl-tRNA(Asn)/glutamyl-tRNA(Gln) amidotransferase subunit A
VDVICAPTAPTVAFPIGEKVDDPLAMYLSDVFTVTMSLAGLPAISVPCGMHSSGLPCGLQIVGNYMEEAKIFSLASTLLQEQPVKLPELQ